MFHIVPIMMLAPVLIAVAYFDLRYMRIPNALSLIAIVILATSALVFPPTDLTGRFGITILVFAVGMVAFAFRMIGGGDVKMLSVVVLAIPVDGIVVFANVFSASMILGILLVLAARRIPATSRWGWKSFGGSQKFPMGLSIALSGLAFPVIALALQSHQS